MSEQSQDPTARAVSSEAEGNGAVDLPAPITPPADDQVTSPGAVTPPPPSVPPEPVAPPPPVNSPSGMAAPLSEAAPPRADRRQSLAWQHPELVIAAAFVGGFVLATILKRLAR